MVGMPMPQERRSDMPENKGKKKDSGKTGAEIGRTNNDLPGKKSHPSEIGRVKNETPGKSSHKPEIGRVKNEKPGEKKHPSEVGVVVNDVKDTKKTKTK
jgi:hypothetical protein